MRVFHANSVFTDFLDLISGKASSSHSHLSVDITDLGSFVNNVLDNLIDGAPTALNTLNELASALGDDPNFAATVTNALGDLDNRLDAIEAWKLSMPKKTARFTGTTDSNGDVTIDMTSAGFTAVPSIGVTYVFNNNNYGTHYNVKALSTTSVTLRVMRNKDTAVLLGGNVDPDEPLASTGIVMIATEY